MITKHAVVPKLCGMLATLALTIALMPGVALAESEWGWVSVEGGPTFYGAPQTITMKGLTSTADSRSQTSYARFVLYKDGQILYTEDAKYTRSDWFAQTPIEWKCELTQYGNYRVEFYRTSNSTRHGDLFEASFTIARVKANPMKVTPKTVTLKSASLKKASKTLAAKKVLVVKKAQGKVTYKKVSGNKKITLSKTGKVTVKKGLKKGTYKVKAKITAAGTVGYKAKTVTKTFKVKVA